MDLAPVLVTPPAVTPVSAEEAKSHLRVSHSDDDTLIEAYLAQAVSRIDAWSGILGRCLINQTWRQDFCGWPSKGLVRLPFPDIRSISSVAYTDQNEADQVVPAEQYQVHHDGRSGFVWFKRAFLSPSLSSDRVDPVRVTFVAGYGAAATDVPAAIKAAILLMVGDFYENREDTAVGVGLDVRPLPRGVDALLAPYRRVGL